MCEYLSPDLDLIIFRSFALFSSDPPSLLYMHPKRSLVLFLSLISISKHSLKVETRFIFSAYREFKTYIIIPLPSLFSIFLENNGRKFWYGYSAFRVFLVLPH